MSDLFDREPLRSPQTVEDINQTIKPDKGQFDGSCNRRACQVSIKGDNWFNRWTSAYYCRRCAGRINDADDGAGDALPCRFVAEPVRVDQP